MEQLQIDGPQPCPECGAQTTNVQGIADCPHCRWSSATTDNRST